MLICSARSSSTTSRRLRRGLAYSLMRAKAASTPSVEVGLVTKENAPRARPCWRSSSRVMICTGICRVSGFCLSWLSTVQPSMSGRNTSSDTAVGWYCLARSSASAPAHRDQHLEALLARQIHHDAGIMRIVLDDQQDGLAGLDLQPIVGDLLDRAFRDRGGHLPRASPVPDAASTTASARRSDRHISAAGRA